MSDKFRADISMPNLTSVCIDSRSETGSKGRLYSSYSGEKGFTDEFHFSKYFKNEVGIAPKGYRENVGISIVAK